MTAACASHNPDWWFRADDDTETAGNRLAERICARCPIAADCLSRAVARDETAGLYGGRWFTEPEFALIAEMPPVPHSYETGCKCGPCLDGHAARVAAYRTKAAATAVAKIDTQLDLFTEASA